MYAYQASPSSKLLQFSSLFHQFFYEIPWSRFSFTQWRKKPWNGLINAMTFMWRTSGRDKLQPQTRSKGCVAEKVTDSIGNQFIKKSVLNKFLGSLKLTACFIPGRPKCSQLPALTIDSIFESLMLWESWSSSRFFWESPIFGLQSMGSLALGMQNFKKKLFIFLACRQLFLK